MFNSAKNEVLSDYKYENVNKYQLLLAFSYLLNESEKILCSHEVFSDYKYEHANILKLLLAFITSGSS